MDQGKLLWSRKSAAEDLDYPFYSIRYKAKQFFETWVIFKWFERTLHWSYLKLFDCQFYAGSVVKPSKYIERKKRKKWGRKKRKMTSTDKKKRKNSSEKIFITFDIDSIWHSYWYELLFFFRTYSMPGRPGHQLWTSCIISISY